MTQDEIKEALEVCTDCYSTCDDCPYDDVGNCGDTLKTDACELIVEQEKEIERLKAGIKQAKIDVLNELKRQAEHCDQWNCEVVPTKYLDEMIEEVKE